MVLEVDARPQPDEVLQGADVALARRVVQRGAPRRVLLVEQLVQVLLGLGLSSTSTRSVCRTASLTAMHAIALRAAEDGVVRTLMTVEASSSRRPPFMTTRCSTLRVLLSLTRMLAPSRMRLMTVRQPPRDAASSNGDLLSLSLALTSAPCQAPRPRKKHLGEPLVQSRSRHLKGAAG